MNSFSDSHFHTIKYQRDYPGRFHDIRHARRWCEEFFEWYNDHHHHSGLALFTPSDVYFNRVEPIAARREQALAKAYAQYPERFVAGPQRVMRPPARVLLNPNEQPVTTAELLLSARDEELAMLRSPAPRMSPVPVIAIPDANHVSPGAARQASLSTQN